MKCIKGSGVERRTVLGLMGVGFPMLLSGKLRAQAAYPPSTLTIMCGYQPGGLADATSRRVGQGLTSVWGSSVSVVNESRPGANGNIAANYVAHAAPDGSTLLVAAYDTLAITAAANLDVGFDPLNDLAATSLIGDIENWFLATPSAPFDSVPEFLDYAKQNRGGISWGSNGVGSSGHLAMEQVNVLTGAEMVHIPYKGAAMLTDLMAGGIDVCLSSRSSTADHVKEGRLKVLAKTGSERSKLSPDLPCFAEVGLESIVIPYAMAAFLPGSAPSELVEAYNRDINKAINGSPLYEQFETSGLSVGNIDPESFKQRIEKDVAVIRDVIEKNNVKLQ